MEKLDIITWAIGGGFAATFGLLLYILTEVRDIDRRLCRMEGSFDFAFREKKEQ